MMMMMIMMINVAMQYLVNLKMNQSTDVLRERRCFFCLSVITFFCHSSCYKNGVSTSEGSGNIVAFDGLFAVVSLQQHLYVSAKGFIACLHIVMFSGNFDCIFSLFVAQVALINDHAVAIW